MSQPFELSFKNKEVRVWIYLLIPMLIVGLILIYNNLAQYLFIPLIVFYGIYYVWRFFHRRKQIEEGNDKH